MMAHPTLLLSLLLAFSAFVQAAPKLKCDATGEEAMDQLIAKAITIGTSRQFPTDTKTMKAFCSDRLNVIGKVENFKDACWRGQLKQTAAVILFSVKGLLNSICKNVNSKKRKEFLAASGCLNAASSSIQKCHNLAKERFIAVESLDSKGSTEGSKKKLGQLCCAYSDFLKCTEAGLEKLGKKTCGEKHIATVMNFIRQLIDNAVNLICGEYTEHTDKCDAFPYLKNEASTKYHSFLAPAIHILATL